MGKPLRAKDGLKSANGLFEVNAKKAKATYHGEEIATVVDIDSAIGKDWVIKTADYTATDGDKLFCDTTAGSFTITLPLNPNIGDEVWIGDLEGTFETHTLTVDRNGKRIMELDENMDCDVNDLSFQMIYTNEDVGWKLILD